MLTALPAYSAKLTDCEASAAQTKVTTVVDVWRAWQIDGFETPQIPQQIPQQILDRIKGVISYVIFFARSNPEGQIFAEIPRYTHSGAMYEYSRDVMANHESAFRDKCDKFLQGSLCVCANEEVFSNPAYNPHPHDVRSNWGNFIELLQETAGLVANRHQLGSVSIAKEMSDFLNLFAIPWETDWNSWEKRKHKEESEEKARRS